MGRRRPSGTDELQIFTSRAREFSRIQPEFRELRRVLLSLGGVETAPPLSPDPMVNFLIDCGIVFGGPVTHKPDPSGNPALSLARAWRRRQRGLQAIGIGYALEPSGLWREHTFGILREGVLEAGAVMEKYFGLMLVGEAADGFSAGALRGDWTALNTEASIPQ